MDYVDMQVENRFWKPAEAVYCKPFVHRRRLARLIPCSPEGSSCSHPKPGNQ